MISMCAIPSKSSAARFLKRSGSELGRWNRNRRRNRLKRDGTGASAAVAAGEGSPESGRELTCPILDCGWGVVESEGGGALSARRSSAVHHASLQYFDLRGFGK